MPKPLRLLALALVMALTIAACGGDNGGSEEDDGDDAAAPGATLTFGTSADPVVLDGALVSDGESLRAIDQMFEGLVTLAPGGTEVVPNLATDWTTSEDGT